MNFTRKIALAAFVVFGVVMLVAAWKLPPFGSPITDSADFILRTGADAAKAANIVCAIVLDYRGYDTLGEATILLAAIAGIVSVLKVEKK